MKISSPFIIIDAGFLIALHNKKDVFHLKALHLGEKFKNRTWISTWPVITEICHFFIQKENIEAIAFLLEMIESDLLNILSLEKTHLSRVKSLMLKYRDLPMDLADASLVILAEEIGCGDILSTDQRDFKTYKWKKRHPFNNFIE